MAYEKRCYLGASDNPNRYAHLAQVKLQEQGYFVYPTSKSGKDILGVRGYTSLNQVDEKLDTITLYLNPIHLIDVLDDILEKKPRRVIFNPGTESETYIKRLEQADIVVERACTLVLLSTNQFELM